MTAVIAGLAAAAAAGVIAWARRRWLVVTVIGQSMVPTLRDGQRILARRPAPGERLAIGEIVVFRLPEPRARQARADRDVEYRVKRIAAGPGDALPDWLARSGAFEGVARIPDAHYAVAGDAADSEDSRQLGLVHRAQVFAWLPGRSRGRP